MIDRMEKAGDILVIDDEFVNLRLLDSLLSKAGYNVRPALSGRLGLAATRNLIPDLILLDIRMPDMDGYAVCEKLKADEPTRDIPVIFLSALHETVDKVRAFSVGGVDYVTKPFQEDEILARVETHISLSRLQKRLEKKNLQFQEEITKRKQAEDTLQKAYIDIKHKVKMRTVELEKLKNQIMEEKYYLQEEINSTHNFNEIITSNQNFLGVLKMAQKGAGSESTVLILGETGTGKELLARLIHELSNRKKQILVKVNCAALPVNLIESELFGHEKGAFTGAENRKIGRFELADQGTIFLDEIGDLPLEIQVKLLRILQDGEFERLGNSNTMNANVRVLAATNRNLEELVSTGRFRRDLFYRLNVFPITSPPLRDRKDDIPQLVNHFVAQNCIKTGRKIKTVAQNVINALCAYHWPGNIRELQNVVERAVILSPGNELQLDDWMTNYTQPQEHASIATLDEAQKDHILKALEVTRGQVFGDAGAARILGIKPTTLQARMKKLGIIIEKSVSKISVNSKIS